jgi:hypothetical protein
VRARWSDLSALLSSFSSLGKILGHLVPLLPTRAAQAEAVQFAATPAIKNDNVIAPIMTQALGVLEHHLQWREESLVHF